MVEKFEEHFTKYLSDRISSYCPKIWKGYEKYSETFSRTFIGRQKENSSGKGKYRGNTDISSWWWWWWWLNTKVTNVLFSVIHVILGKNITSYSKNMRFLNFCIDKLIKSHFNVFIWLRNKISCIKIILFHFHSLSKQLLFFNYSTNAILTKMLKSHKYSYNLINFPPKFPSLFSLH